MGKRSSSFEDCIERNPEGLDLHNHPSFFRPLLDRINIPVENLLAWTITLGEFVGVSLGALAGHLDDGPAYFHPTARIDRVDDQYGNFGIVLHVEAFLALQRGVDEKNLVIVIDPDDAGLRGAIWHDGC